MSDAIPWARVPPELAERVRPALPAVVERIIAAVREEVPEYDRPMNGELGRLIEVGSTVALGQFIDLVGRDADVGDTALYEDMGRAEQRAGRTLDALQSAFRVGARVAWRELAQFLTDAETQTVFVMAESVFAYIDRLADAAVSGYAQEQTAREGSLRARRHALVELLVTTPAPDADAVARAAEQAEWPLPGTLAALVLPDEEIAALVRRLPVHTIAAGIGDVAVLLVPDSDAPGRRRHLARALAGRRAVLGPTVEWAQTAHSARRALAGWPLHAAGRLGEDALAVANEHLVALLLAADDRLTADLVALRLGPLEGMTPAARRRAERTLRVWLRAHYDVATSAEVLGVHPQTVRYRLAGLRELFGDAFSDPAFRLELALALRAVDAPSA